MNRIAKKSLYLTLLHSTQVARSLAKKFREDQREDKYNRYIQRTFKKFEELCIKFEKGSLKNEDVRSAIAAIRSNVVDISFGQAQKGLNVLLKYEFFLFRDESALGRELDCPLDGKIQTILNRELLRGDKEDVSLLKMERSDYERIQDKIAKLHQSRVAFDLKLDEQNLNERNLLPP